ncbi:MAG: sterol desaturase family protein [Burkholderiales bacterium]
MTMMTDRHNMSERQRKFRAEYMEGVRDGYSGPFHIGVIYVVGLTMIGWCLSRLQGASWEWLLVIPVFAFSNMFEWWIHKNVMHRLIDVWALRAIYDRHTRQHHQYFTDNEMTVSSSREWRIIFFPWRALFSFMALGAPFALALAWLVNPNAGYILMVTIVGQYLIYETFHFSCHVHENWAVRNIPFVNTIRRHHTAHHNYGVMMGRNMNLTFPIADWIMGTSDLDRGLIGTIFNGVNEDYVKPELKPIIEKFQRPDAPVTIDGPINNGAGQPAV